MSRPGPKSTRPSPTIKDVARELGVSIATVSRALSHPELLEAKTRERVLKMVKRAGYRPNPLARGLRRGRTHTILFVAANLSPFFLEIFAGAEEITRRAGFALLLGNSDGDPENSRACFEQAASGRADGLILLSIAPAEYPRPGLPFPPVVTVLERQKHHAVPLIHVDDRAGAREATRHLIERGHRRIGHITGHEDVPSAARRQQGYLEALRESGLTAPSDLIIPGNFLMRSGVAGMDRLLRLQRPPTAVLCANDETAFGAIRLLHQRGLSVPNDMSIVGFDNLNMSEFYNPPLTTVDIPRRELGRRAALELMERINGHDVAHEVVLPSRLIVRESTAAPRRLR